MKKTNNYMAKKVGILIGVLIFLLICSIGYIASEKYSEWKIAKDVSLYQQGATYGYQQAIIGVAQEASKCQQVPLVIGNQTMNIIWVDCLQQQAQEQ